MDREYDILGGYVPAFVEHLADTRARLELRIPSQVNTTTSSSIKGDSNAEEFFDWVPAERDAFFRALSVHSRWRPDLIAASVPTRAEWEVWSYLEALEEGAVALAMAQGGSEDVQMGVDASPPSSVAPSISNSHFDDLDMDEGESAVWCEPALEVSQDWIDVEERMAAWIIRQERLTSGDDKLAGDMEADRVDDAPVKRKRGRPRRTGKVPDESRIEERTGLNEDGHSPSPVAVTMTARKREALMGCLEVSHLAALDNILREDEEVAQDRSKSREGSVTVTAPTRLGDEGSVHAGDTEALNLSNQMDVLQGTRDAVIDPVLLALSGVTVPATHHLDQDSNQCPLADCAPIQAPIESTFHFPSFQPTSLDFQPEASNMFTLQPDEVALYKPNQVANVEQDLSSFSPRSRRRIQKRLYMRRKRASLREDSESVTEAGIARLKPGKKAKLERSKSPAVSNPVSESEAPSDAETELTEHVSKKNKGGLTLPYKLKARFSELGVDAAYLRGRGMDLFNLSALGRLMGLFASVECDEEMYTITPSIDAELVRCLQAAMVSFVTDVIHRAIVWKEREVRLKQRCQAWRHGDQITHGAIEHALQVIGARYHSHKEYFESLEALQGFSKEKCPSAPPEDGSADSDTEGADLTADPYVLSSHREVYTPLVRPPCVLGVGPLASVTRTYEREATRTRRGPSADVDEEELMSDETDDEAMEVELREEEEVDALDMELAATEESTLWKVIGTD